MRAASPDCLDACRLLRFQTQWERRFHEYDLLTIAGIPADEAERIVNQAEADRAAFTHPELERNAA